MSRQEDDRLDSVSGDRARTFLIMSNSECKRLSAKIKGRVQGVGYRYFAEAEANRLGLTGFVRNLPNGDVEVIAEGDEKVLQGFVALLRQGPLSAEVTEVESALLPATGEFHDFRVRRWW